MNREIVEDVFKDSKFTLKDVGFDGKAAYIVTHPELPDAKWIATFEETEGYDFRKKCEDMLVEFNKLADHKIKKLKDD